MEREKVLKKLVHSLSVYKRVDVEPFPEGISVQSLETPSARGEFYPNETCHYLRLLKLARKLVGKVRNLAGLINTLEKMGLSVQVGIEQEETECGKLVFTAIRKVVSDSFALEITEQGEVVLSLRTKSPLKDVEKVKKVLKLLN